MNQNVMAGAPLDKPIPILGQQPPIPGAAAQILIRFMQPSEVNDETALVPCDPDHADPYVDTMSSQDPYLSSNKSGIFPPIMEGPLSMNQNILWFIANNLRNNPRKGRDQPRSGECFKCGSSDHWARDWGLEIAVQSRGR